MRSCAFAGAASAAKRRSAMPSGPLFNCNRNNPRELSREASLGFAASLAVKSLSAFSMLFAAGAKRSWCESSRSPVVCDRAHRGAINPSNRGAMCRSDLFSRRVIPSSLYQGGKSPLHEAKKARPGQPLWPRNKDKYAQHSQFCQFTVTKPVPLVGTVY